MNTDKTIIPLAKVQARLAVIVGQHFVHPASAALLR